MEAPAPHRAAILTLARSLDQIGSALQTLSRQLTDMAAPDVATRAADSSQR
jgi:phage-related minor tail protein